MTGIKVSGQMQRMLEAQADNVVGKERGRAEESKVEGGFRRRGGRRMHSTTIVKGGAETMRKAEAMASDAEDRRGARGRG